MKARGISIMAIMLLFGKGIIAQTAEDIFKKHLEAVGGEANWTKVNSVKITGSMQQGVDKISVVQTIVNDKGYRAEIKVNGQLGYQIATPFEGWMFMPFGGQKEPAKMSADQLKSAVRQLNYRRSQFVDRSAITSMLMEGNDTVGNIVCHKMRVKGTDGAEQVVYFDSRTHYLVRIDEPGGIVDGEQDVFTFSNFKKLPEGITVAMTIGTPQGPVNYSNIEINIPVSDSIFKPSIK